MRASAESQADNLVKTTAKVSRRGKPKTPAIHVGKVRKKTGGMVYVLC